MDDVISRQALCEYALNQKNKSVTPNDIMRFPSAQPTEASCWGCNCAKMERLKEQKTFSEMVHLHDAETHDKRTETHACDYIERQDAIEAIKGLPTWWADDGGYYGGAQPPMKALLDPTDAVSAIEKLPPAQPEIIYCKDCKHWRQQTNYQGVSLPFGFCESDDMWRSLYGETYEVSHIDTYGDFYCAYGEERRTDDSV